MTLVLRRRRRSRKIAELARVLAALDDAARDSRSEPRRRDRSAVGVARA